LDTPGFAPCRTRRLVLRRLVESDAGRLFEIFGDPRTPPEVHAIVRPANLASSHVLRKIGMPEIGTLDDVPGKAPSLLFRALRA
jgi:RimJ/RimL family protein N-acetyltransferase